MKLAFGAGLAMVLAGCAATPPENFQPVTTERADMRWQRADKVLASKAAFTRAAGDAVRLRLGKEPLLEVTLYPKDWMEAKGSLMQKNWRGFRQDAPLTLAAWSAFLSVYRHSKELPPGEKEIHTMADRVAYSTTPDGKLRSLSLINNDTGEVISGRFER